MSNPSFPPAAHARPDGRWIETAAVFLALFGVAILLRPALPVFEARYLSVAWEMYLRHDWLAPLTLNFAPYHHKPPLLFWIINSFWSVFGTSRWAALVPIVLAALASLLLTMVLARRLLPESGERARLIMLGSSGFLIYATVMLFDLTLTSFVITALLCLLAYEQHRRPRYIALLALALGLGVLTKGPVTYLYVIFPALLAPLWSRGVHGLRNWYPAMAAALLLSLLPVALWLLPVLSQSTQDFGYWLVWEQTAGRITGSFASSHARPLYFFVLVLPLLLMPWIFFKQFWKELVSIPTGNRMPPGITFLLCWIVPTFIAFSLVSGKQPHYLVPLMPGFAILGAFLLRGISLRALRITSYAMVLGFIILHIGMPASLTDRYDLGPVAAALRTTGTRPLAFVGAPYRGELTFLGRLERPMQPVKPEDLHTWLDTNPDGIAVVRYRRPEEIAQYEVVMERPYRGGSMALVVSGGAGNMMAGL